MRRLTTIKVRIGLAVVAGVVASAATALVAVERGLPVLAAMALAAVIALGVVQLLARGLTRPLRELAAASRALARGDLGTRVREAGTDETRELARAFNAMAGELGETDRRRRELVANVSHELRTPLGALQAKLENALDGIEPADPETLAAMLAQTQRLGRLVAQLLDLSRLEAADRDHPFDLRPFELADVLEQAAREARLHAPETVAVDVRAPRPLVVAGDAERVQQVVANLVDNALRFSPRPGEVRIRGERDGARVRILVSDAGPGIPAASAARVFERFHRVDTARTAGGAGLGLAIARWIVELHGGTIRADGVEPQGCRMVVELPGAAG